MRKAQDAEIEKIPWFVLPGAAGFLLVGIVVGALLADLLGIGRVTFLLRFAPLFAWACTFGLALYLGRHPHRRALPDPQESEAFLTWSGSGRRGG